MRLDRTTLVMSAVVAAVGCREAPVKSSVGVRPPPQPSADVAGEMPEVPPLWQIPTQVSYSGPPLPAEVQEGIALYQPYFDQYAWQLFIALNWPACPKNSEDPNCRPGEPDTRRWIGSGGDAPTVWEQWSSADEVFRPGGAEPRPWGARGTSEVCKNHEELGVRASAMPLLTMDDGSLSLDALRRHTPREHHAGLDPTPPAAGPLIDQKGRWARFEVYINKTAYDYIVDNKLYSKAGQKAFVADKKQVAFPPTTNKDDDPISIEVKVAWKAVDDHEKKRYHTTEAVFVDGSGNCRTRTIGLVAMHIMAKIARNPTRIWATFEHVDNHCREEWLTRGYAYVGGSFCNRDCRDKPADPACVPNRPPEKPWNPPADPAEPGDRPPTQVVRERPLPLTSIQINSLMAAFLSSTSTRAAPSVWSNYELVGTQWVMPIVSNLNKSRSYRPIVPGAKPAPQYIPRFQREQACSENPYLLGDSDSCLGLIVPPILANSIIETYEQKSSSCLGCHAEAKTSAGSSADYAFILERAQ